MIKVYVVFGNMEDDEPTCICAYESDAKALLVGNDVGDYIEVEILASTWSALLKQIWNHF